jgi:prepilin-type N-terminal cleavage/methylation domain-containing protein
MKKAGFSLIEVLVAIILVGIAIAALVAAGSSFTRANAAGAELATAEFLVEQIRELTAMLPYDDLDDFVGVDGVRSFCPPIGADRTVLNDFAAFTQKVTVKNVSESDLEQVVGYHSRFVRVSVEVSLNSRPISSVSWIRANYAK